MNRFFLSALLLLSAFTAKAELRTAEEAEAVALGFFSRETARSKGSLPALKRVSLSSDSLYVFADDSGRRVFVSGSTLLNPVLGYTDSPVLPEAELPVNLIDWIQHAKDAVRRLEQYPALSVVGRQTASSVVIEPLLGKIEWDQGAPWNNQCPLLKGARTYVGCVATALSQIMYYHSYAVGRGSISYTDESKHDISVDFSTQTYDFSVMGPTAATTKDRSELAKFCFHVGAACQMSYDGSEGSGAYSWNAAQGVAQYFSYSDLVTYMERVMFTYEEWNRLLVNELAAKRPILYSGYSEDAGHAFVLDGIDETGAYHVNWGWGGGYNGYYDVNILAPGGYGIGATSSAMDGFRDDQGAIFNLAPSLSEGSDGVQYWCGIESEGMGIADTVVALGETVKIVEYGIFNFRHDIDGDGTYGILIQQDGIDVREIPVGKTPFQDYGYGLWCWNNRSSTVYVPFTVPADLADGTYQVWIYFRPEGNSDRRDVFRSYAWCPSCVTMTVADGRATFVDAWPWDYDIQASEWSSDKLSDSYILGVLTNYSVTARIGNQDLYGHFTLVWDENGKRQSKTFSDAAYEAGSEVTLSALYKPRTSGTAVSKLYFSPDNVGVPSQTYGDTVFCVGSSATYLIEEPVATGDGSNLRLISTPSLESGTVAIGSEVTFAVSVSNNGSSPFEGKLALRFYEEEDASKTVVLTITGDVAVPAEGKATAHLTGTLTDDLEAGRTYVGYACYVGNEGYSKLFVSKINVLNKITITPAQASANAIGILSADPSSLPFRGGLGRGYYNLYGQRVAPGHKGLVIQNGQLRLKL